MILEPVDQAVVDWDELDGFDDRMVFQTRDWIEFVAATQGAEPIIARVVDRGSTVGYFTGLVARRYGFRVLGSPMPGWTTAFMGFNLDRGVSRRAATEALVEFAFGPLGCAHFELWDRRLTLADVDGLGFEHTPWRGVEVDLRPDEDEIFAAMKSTCRTAIRKAGKSGVVIEEAEADGFVDDFYPQLEDVFVKQNLVPPFDAARVRALIRHVHPSGRLLLLRAVSPDGECIATGIFPGLNRTMHFLSGASWRRHQNLRPNEALIWHAMRTWKSRGIEACDLGGYMDYKRKYGGEEIHLPFLRKSRSGAVSLLRNLAARTFAARQSLRGFARSATGRGRGDGG